MRTVLIGGTSGIGLEIARARAGRVVRRQARLAVAHHAGVDAAWESAVAARAADRVTPLAIRQLATASNRLELTSASHISLRRAA